MGFFDYLKNLLPNKKADDSAQALQPKQTEQSSTDQLLNYGVSLMNGTTPRMPENHDGSLLSMAQTAMNYANKGQKSDEEKAAEVDRQNQEMANFSQENDIALAQYRAGRGQPLPTVPVPVSKADLMPNLHPLTGEQPYDPLTGVEDSPITLESDSSLLKKRLALLKPSPTLGGNFN